MERLNLQDLLQEEHEPVYPDKLLWDLQTRDVLRQLHLNGSRYIHFVVGMVSTHSALWVSDRTQNIISQTIPRLLFTLPQKMRTCEILPLMICFILWERNWASLKYFFFPSSPLHRVIIWRGPFITNTNMFLPFSSFQHIKLNSRIVLPLNPHRY